MSLEASNWAWRQATSSSGERLVLVCLANSANEHKDVDSGQITWVSCGQIAERTQLGESTVRRHLVNLEAVGLVEKVRRRRRKDGSLGTWIYRLPTAQERAPGHRSPVSAHELEDQELKVEDSLRSSSRSDSKIRETTEGSKEPSEAQKVTKAYWDRHVEEHDGVKPAGTWPQLHSVVKASLGKGLTGDQIVDAMLKITRVKPTVALVIEEAQKARRREAEAPVTPALSSATMQTWKALEIAVREGRMSKRHEGANLADLVDKPETCSVIEVLLRGGWNKTKSEVAARAVIFWLHAGFRTPTVADLTDRAMPVDPAYFKPDDDLSKVIASAWKMGSYG